MFGTEYTTLFLEDEISYSGSQLSSHWVRHYLKPPRLEKRLPYTHTFVGFIGPAQVDAAELVNLDSSEEGAFIFSKRMLHFLIELFGVGMPEIVLMQRLLICITRECIAEVSGKQLTREGDDLFYIRHLTGTVDPERFKLSVSVATISLVSGLIHIGLNIDSKDTPIPTFSLEELGIDPRKLFDDVSAKFWTELGSVFTACRKVKPIVDEWRK